MDKDSSISSLPSENESIDLGNDPIDPKHMVKLELDTEYDIDDNDTISFNSPNSDWCDDYSDQDSDNEVQSKSAKQNDDSISLNQKSS